MSVALVIEDDPSLRDIICRFLTAHGYDVKVAASGEEALSLESASHVDILISDVVLPGRDGFQIAAEIMRRSPHVRSFFMSGYFDDAMAAAAGVPAGAAMLKKPFALADLLCLVRADSAENGLPTAETIHTDGVAEPRPARAGAETGAAPEENSGPATEARENIRRLIAVVEAVPDMIVLAHLSGRVFYRNGAARAFFDTGGSLPRLRELFPPDRLNEFDQALSCALRDGQWQGDSEMVDAAGRRTPVAHTLLLLRDCEGQPECVASVCRNIAEDRRQQTLLHQSEHRFRHLVEDVGDILFEQDPEGRWAFLNPAWQEVTGFTPEESLGRPYLDFVHPDDRDASSARFSGLLSSGQHDIVQATRYRTKDGRWRWLEVRVRRIVDAGGALVGTVGSLRDITARRDLAEELSKAHQQALRASAMMAEFLANMSHEIRTPLNGVLGLITILLDTKLAVEQREIAASAFRSGETLMNLVNDILDISKIESGTLTIEQLPFDVRKWAEEVTAVAFRRAAAKGLDVSLVVDERVPDRVIGDPTRLRQIATNLLDNAIKFTDAGRVVVAVCPDAVGGRRMLRITVSDSGIGIPIDKHGVVFEKFRQADSSTTRRYGGTGLGLAISRQLAQRMGGDVGLKSEIGKGSTFWFTIPLVVAGGPPAASDEPSVIAKRIKQAAPRVLVAEDNPTNQLVARRFLEKIGCCVEVVSNGCEAVARVHADTFAVVFMDCQMPVMDGYEATRRIRAQGSDVPIVAMTAHAMAGDRERCLAAGMTDYVPKPLKLDLVVMALDRVLEVTSDTTS